MNSMNIGNQVYVPPPSISDFIQAPAIGMTPKSSNGGKFSDILSKSLNAQKVDVNFSIHAQQRLTTRGINLSDEDMARLDDAIDKADEKGAHNSLIVLDGNALVVNIDNRTVVTAMDLSGASKNVFTQIDSAVVA